MENEGNKLRRNLEKLLANVFVITLLVCMNIAVNIWGWGLRPRSWWWILGIGWAATMFVHQIARKLVE